MLKRFKGGIKPDGRKGLSSDLNIEIMPPPSVVYVPMQQHSGCPAVPTVKVGDEVVTGRLIGRAEVKNSCAVFSPCCGKVKAIEDRPAAKGNCTHIVIENNQKKDAEHLPPIVNPTAEQIVQRVYDCGIAGMGGAGFPTATKLAVNSKINTLIINGAECEPYITCDYRIMREYTQKFVSGSLLIQKAIGADEVIIGVEKNKSDAISILNDYIKTNNLQGIRVAPLNVKYPQGSDRQLIYSLTGKRIAKGIRSGSFGVMVFNVHTALTVYLAVAEGRQCYSRVMTVSGGGIKTPKNIWVSTGTLFKDVIEFCGGFNEKTPPVKIVSGGPMTGSAVFNTDIAVTKITGCVLSMSESESEAINPSACINCGKCASVCPMRLMPMNIDKYARAGRYDDAERWGAEHCIECGCCSYICPAKRSLVQSVALAKSKIKGGRK